MFEDIKSESTRRLLEIRELIRYIKKSESRSKISINNNITSLKGLFFVHLYGVLEFTVSSCISSSINHINGLEIKICKLKPRLLSIALHSDLDSLSMVGNNKKWERRWDIFDKLENEDIFNVSDDIVPTDGKNLRHRQLKCIFESFGITESVLPRQEIGGRINEIVEFRNLIAHGNEPPSEIGKRFSPDDLLKRYEDISEYCTYVILVFENYLNNNIYMKS